jgi:lipopolysaccharide/colanic/teichoic acid biosynthesis glycosyltransferase
MAVSASVSLPREDSTARRDPPPIFLQPKRTRRRSAGQTGRAVHARPVFKEPGRSRLKRMFDVAVASSVLLFFAPMLAAIAIAIKTTSPGPILFRHYKFRTMYQHMTDRSGVHQTTSDDPRVTAIGRLLRHTSLDELPQLINVIRGHMSLVGPRPHVPGMLAASMPYEHLVPYYFERHVVRPGVTGLAQVSGYRGTTTDAQSAIGRISCDLEYIETWSLWLDLRIILRTVQREFLSGNGV